MSPTPPKRPHTTLTFAQSLDAKIAGAEGRQLILSGEESMIMTHWMRTMHDGILIGIGTALNDDPQLNVRKLPPPNAMSYHLPRPIIIDTYLRLPPTCKLLLNYQNKVGRRPWVVCGHVAAPSTHSRLPADTAETRLLRKQALEAAGARIIEIPMTPTADGIGTRLSIPSVLQTLKELGISSVMVEGGAQIISSFMEENTADTLIITIAPTFVGASGVAYNCITEAGNLKYMGTMAIGKDSVFTFCHKDSNIFYQGHF
ncbi:dihydrofolate reductase-like domain-containing protein [Gymnopilus junonius]|uniref:2,5-diamino-6-ribosylamino-4(3H)-pyrimidinone 5'-phosphate reductase n=1 Tax=Gymnopilus junonius TaxID=109634 RepID=A0A9P5NVM7_GYMJU|nr:dihydrofolate reductase-like domain-containing protein [Gymnopilus junonius]